MAVRLITGSRKRGGLLAYYVEWDMRRALGSVLFDDEELPARRKTRDPVATAKPSASVQRKKTQRTMSDGLGVYSFNTLLEDLGTLCRNREVVKDRWAARTASLPDCRNTWSRHFPLRGASIVSSARRAPECSGSIWSTLRYSAIASSIRPRRFKAPARL